MPKISCRQRNSNWKSHIQCKHQSTREDIEKNISSSTGEKNISVEDDSCIDIDVQPLHIPTYVATYIQK
eukprot:2291908-Ditylum_brightwellii.AAC.1